MGDRYYNQMYKLRHPEQKLNQYQIVKRKQKRMAWTDEQKQEVIEAYVAAEPTPENSMEVVKELAEEFDQSPNGVRMILTRAGVYVKKTPATGSSNSGGTRVSKAAAQEALSAAIRDAGQEVDEDIVSKLTGKAANYLAEVINAVNN